MKRLFFTAAVYFALVISAQLGWGFRQALAEQRQKQEFAEAADAIQLAAGAIYEQRPACELKMAIAMGLAGEDRPSNKQVIRDIATNICDAFLNSPTPSLMLAGGNVPAAIAIMAGALENPDTFGKALIESMGYMTAEEQNTLRSAKMVFDKGQERAVILGAFARLVKNMEE